MRPVLKVPGTERLKPNYDEVLSNVALQIDLRRYIKGHFAIKQHFQALDSDQSGVLEREEFVEALKQFNLGDCVTPDVADLLLNVVGWSSRTSAKHPTNVVIRRTESARLYERSP
jgi:hypothetical protein